MVARAYNINSENYVYKEYFIICMFIIEYLCVRFYINFTNITRMGNIETLQYFSCSDNCLSSIDFFTKTLLMFVTFLETSMLWVLFLHLTSQYYLSVIF